MTRIERLRVVDVASRQNDMTRLRNSLGFSLLEIMMALALIAVISGMTFMSLQPTLKAGRVDTAYNLSLMTLRQARQQAVDKRKTYIVTFLAPRTIQVFRQDGAVNPNPAPPPVLVNTYVLPPDIGFRNEPGIPSSSTSTPDGFGVGSFAVDFNVDNAGGYNSVYFRPDGGAYDQLGRVNNGVVYMSRANELTSSRAISLFGLTGQLHGWRLQKNLTTGTTSWMPQ